MKRALIFTAKDVETAAVRQQLLEPIGDPRTAQAYVYNVFHLRSASANNQPVKDVQIALYETGRGQEKVMPAIAPIVGDFNPDIVLYVGCAGGDPSHLNIYDVFIPTHVWPYEKGKETAKGFVTRAHPLEPTGTLKDMALAIAERPKWRQRVPLETPGESVSVKLGALASGSKVLADEEGAIWAAAKAINDEIIAVETECFGFLSAMAPLHRPHLMIRGISDLLTNKNTEGKRVDDDRQKHATVHAAALAAQLILDVDYKTLRQGRGASSSPLATKLRGFWKSEWKYGDEVCAELLGLNAIAGDGSRISGRRAAKFSKHQYTYELSGLLYVDRLHLIAVPSDHTPFSVSLVLKPAGNFGDRLAGIAVRPLSNLPIPRLGRNVSRYEDELWATTVTYERVLEPAAEVPELWNIYEQHG
jgi:nucleoside phosphorylase